MANSRWARRHHLVNEELLAAAGLLLLYIAIFNGHLQSTDGMLMFHQARTIFEDRSIRFTHPLVWGGSVSDNKYGLGLSLLYLPGLALFSWLRPFVHVQQGDIDLATLYLNPLYSVAGAPVHLIVTAATAYLVARFCRQLGLSRASAFWSLLLFGVGSPALVYARGDFAQPLTALCWIGSLYAAFLFRAQGKLRSALLAAFAVFYAVLTRPVDGALLAPGVLLLLVGHVNVRRYTRREWQGIVLVLVGFCAGVAVTLWVNYLRYGQLIASGYVAEGFWTPLWVGVSGLLVSPSKGLLWSFPAVVMAPLGMRYLWKCQQRMVVLVLTGLSLALLGMMGKWHMWWGGVNWGPRLLLPSLPLLAVLVGAGINALQGKRRTLIAGVLLLGGVVWALPAVIIDSNAGYLYLFNGSRASYRLDGYPPLGAWRMLDRWFAAMPTDVNAIDIYWLRFAQMTDGATLLPLIACLGGAGAIFYRLYRTHPDSDHVVTQTNSRIAQWLPFANLSFWILLGLFGGMLGVFIVTAPVPIIQPWTLDDRIIQTSGLYATELDANQIPYRWTTEQATVNVPVNPARGNLTVRLKKGSSDQQASLAIKDQAAISLNSDASERDYHLLIPYSFLQGRTLQFQILSQTYQPQDEHRWLGVVYRGVSWTPITEVAELRWLHELFHILSGVLGVLVLFTVVRPVTRSNIVRRPNTYPDSSGSRA